MKKALNIDPESLKNHLKMRGFQDRYSELFSSMFDFFADEILESANVWIV
jgi:hypothetical protein